MEKKTQKNTTKKPLPKEKDTALSSLDAMLRRMGSKKVPAPKDAGAVVIFPGPDGKVDMIDAVERLYGIKHDKGDRVIRIRGGKIVSDEEVNLTDSYLKPESRQEYIFNCKKRELDIS
jgi:hypothetical protein